MRLLLLQARKKNDAASAHELSAFANVIGVDEAAITTWDLLQGVPPDRVLLTADCILVGGSGDFSVNGHGEHSWIRRFIDSMGFLTTREIPVFASCFGFQALVLACGGRIASDPGRAEFGTFDVTVSAAGSDDPLFREVAPRFSAQFGHADHAASLPSSFVNLARTERNEYQAARVRGRDIYMTQFHPELSMEANRERALMYLESYVDRGALEGTEELHASFRPSEAASGVLRRFVEGLRERGSQHEAGP